MREQVVNWKWDQSEENAIFIMRQSICTHLYASVDFLLVEILSSCDDHQTLPQTVDGLEWWGTIKCVRKIFKFELFNNYLF
jgi:hypothetical protein